MGPARHQFSDRTICRWGKCRAGRSHQRNRGTDPAIRPYLRQGPRTHVRFRIALNTVGTRKRHALSRSPTAVRVTSLRSGHTPTCAQVSRRSAARRVPTGSWRSGSPGETSDSQVASIAGGPSPSPDACLACSMSTPPGHPCQQARMPPIRRSPDRFPARGQPLVGRLVHDHHVVLDTSASGAHDEAQPGTPLDHAPPSMERRNASNGFHRSAWCASMLHPIVRGAL